MNQLIPAGIVLYSGFSTKSVPKISLIVSTTPARFVKLLTTKLEPALRTSESFPANPESVARTSVPFLTRKECQNQSNS